jgi:hypothetical protein
LALDGDDALDDALDDAMDNDEDDFFFFFVTDSINACISSSVTLPDLMMPLSCLVSSSSFAPD